MRPAASRRRAHRRLRNALLAASILALTAAGRATPPPQPVPIQAVVVSGDRQTATAFVAPGEKKYITDFSALLVVRVTAPSPPKGERRRVRFRCLTPGCAFDPSEQPETDERKIDHTEPPVYDSDVDRKTGQASVHVAIESDRAVGPYVIEAAPLPRKGERAVPVRFTLTSR